MNLLEYCNSFVKNGEVIHHQGNKLCFETAALFDSSYYKDSLAQKIVEAVITKTVEVDEIELWELDKIYLTEKQKQFITGTVIHVDQEITDASSLVKYPYYKIIGKQVTPVQAKEISDYIQHNHFHFCDWVTAQGVINTTGTTAKWPDLAEYYEDIISWKLHFSYLDMLIVIASFEDCMLTEPYNLSFEDTIDLGFHIYSNRIEVLNEDNIKRLYKEYKQGMELEVQ